LPSGAGEAEPQALINPHDTNAVSGNTAVSDVFIIGKRRIVGLTYGIN